MEEIAKLIVDVVDFPKKGIVFKDITPLLMNSKALSTVINDCVNFCKNKGINKVVAMESRGFLLGVPVSIGLKAGFIPIRKSGKLPRKTVKETYALEYGTDTVEMHEDAIKKGDKVLIIDDVLATGGTAKAVVKLVEKCEGEVIHLYFLIELVFLNGIKKLKNYSVKSLIKYHK